MGKKKQRKEDALSESVKLKPVELTADTEKTKGNDNPVRAVHMLPDSKGKTMEIVVSEFLRKVIVDLNIWLVTVKDEFLPAEGNVLVPMDPWIRYLIEDVTKLERRSHQIRYPYSSTANIRGSDSKSALNKKLNWSVFHDEDALDSLFLAQSWFDKIWKNRTGNHETAVVMNQKSYYTTKPGQIGNVGQFDGISYEFAEELYLASPQNGKLPLAFLFDLEIPLVSSWEEGEPAMLYELYRRHLIEIRKEKGAYTLSVREDELKSYVSEVVAGRQTELLYYSFTPEFIGQLQSQMEKEITAQREMALAHELLSRDTVRIDMTEYPEKMLEDPNQGSWDLWETELLGCDRARTQKTYYARDPRLDIQEDGIIGIDFGTKSTVVVCKEGNSRTIPVRVGIGRIDQAPRAKDYENPTVMQFRNVESFLESYRSSAGRPMTSWEDICVSHTAFQAWKENENTGNYFSFFSDLKQWAGTPNRRARIRDAKGKEIDLQPYETLGEQDFDPIELYAYYIGLYINNMHRGHIYLKYLLSFPVTYTKAVRDRILNSFRKGLSHSLPNAILWDEACMEKFQVLEGAGEPAAYAVCALQQFHLNPEPGKKIPYGVFDFGGGTTDFDFGIWRRASGPKERRYKYVIQHFGDGGDKYLGGENLLELLSFEVFKANRDALRSEGIPFTMPPQCEHFAGDEFLISDSQEAYTNMRQMMERLRPFWERHEEYESLFTNGVIKLRLFTNKGEKKESVELMVDTAKLEEILKNRINDGVTEFFNAMLGLFTHGAGEELHGLKKFYILLAGNASKSEILKEEFRCACEKYSEQFRAALDRYSLESDFNPEDEETEENSPFEILYPLGTPEADRQIGISNPDELERPTGKTGVAIGLVESSRNSQIKVISQKAADDSNEIRFRFWVGYFDDENEDFFRAYLNRDSAYDAWVEYLDAGVNEFDLFYTTAPSAALRGKLPMEDSRVKKKILSFPASAEDEDAMIYIRPTAPNRIEYTVVRSLEDAAAGRYAFDPIPETLED